MTPNAFFKNPKTMARDAHSRTKPFSGRQIVWRSLRAVVFFLLLIEVVWLVAANLLLRPHGVVSGWVNLKPEKIRMDWSEARSFWPGDLRVRNFQIRSNHLPAIFFPRGMGRQRPMNYFWHHLMLCQPFQIFSRVSPHWHSIYFRPNIRLHKRNIFKNGYKWTLPRC